MRSNRIILAGLCAATLFSCTQEITVGIAEKQALTLGVTNELPGDGTKTSLGLDNTVSFNPGDRISVFDGVSHNIFTTADGGGNAYFSGEAAAATSYLIVSPYSKTNRMVSVSVAEYIIPAIQVATPGSFDPAAFISVGKSFGTNANLYNGVALVEVEVPDGLTVKQIQLGGKADNSYALAGTFTLNTNTQVASLSSAGSTIITLVPRKGQSTIAPGKYYIAVGPERTYPGFTLAYVNEDDILCKRTSTNSATIRRNHILPLGSLNTTNFIPQTGKAVLRQAGDEVQFTGRLKMLAGGSGSAITDDKNIRKIVFHSHTLVPSAITGGSNIVSSGQQGGTVGIYASYSDGVVDVYTEAPSITLHTNSAGLFRNFAALESVEFDAVTADANTSFNMMFRNDYSLRRVDFGNCDFSMVKDMSFMFSDAQMQDQFALKALKQVNFGSTSTSSVTNFKGMFWGCTWMTELILGHNFTVNHLSDKSMCNQMFTNTAMASNQAAGSDVSKKCRLYMTQEQYNDLRASGGTGVCANSNLNPARFWFNAVTASTPAPGLTPEEEPETDPEPGPTGLKFAIFGDSISTFKDYIQGYTTYYPYNPNSESNTVDSVDKTYWMKLINKFDGASLAINISYSGSCVSYAQDTYTCSSSGKANKLAARQTRCFLERYKEHPDLGNPDVILLYGGTNDRVYSRGNVPCPGDQTKVDWTAKGIANVTSADGGKGQYAPAAGEVEALCTTASENLDTDFFMHAYLLLLRKMLADHPDAKIACLVGDGMTDAQDEWIKGVCTYLDANGYQNRIKAVSFHKAGNTDGKHYDTNIPKQQASVHPNALGMSYMADFIYNEIKDWVK